MSKAAVDSMMISVDEERLFYVFGVMNLTPVRKACSRVVSGLQAFMTKTVITHHDEKIFFARR